MLRSNPIPAGTRPYYVAYTQSLPEGDAARNWSLDGRDARFRLATAGFDRPRRFAYCVFVSYRQFHPQNDTKRSLNGRETAGIGRLAGDGWGWLGKVCEAGDGWGSSGPSGYRRQLLKPLAAPETASRS